MILLTKRKYANDVKFGHELKQLMLKGVDKIVNAVSVTLGPKVIYIVFINYIIG